MKKIARIIILLLISFSLFSVYAEDGLYSDRSVSIIDEKDENNPNIIYAKALKGIHIFKGTNKGFELFRMPNRLEGIIMLLRLLGEDEEAKSVDPATCPFNDVPNWGKQAVAYAYQKGYTKGINNTQFGTESALKTKDYCTFLLRALKFEEGDYTWETAIEDIIKFSAITDRDMKVFHGYFSRGDLARFSYKALLSNTKNGDFLLNSLVDKHIISIEKADEFITSELAENIKKETKKKKEILLKVKKLMDAGLSKEEAKLATFINKYREEQGLKPLPISKSLTEVARIHVKDSNENNPKAQVDERGIKGNSHSWSKSNKWTGGAYTSDHKYAKMMWSKPLELTSYNGKGYEIAVFSSGGMDYLQAIDLWKSSPPHNAVIIGKGRWNELKTFGVGIDGNYSFIWFGQVDDPNGYYSE